MPSKEQELPAKNPGPQDDPFRLWAVSLNGALEEPIANGHDGALSERSRNGGASEATTRADSSQSPDAQPQGDKKYRDEWLAALRRRVRIENERRLLKQEAMSQALEEFNRLHAPVERKWSKPNRPRRVDKYETLLWRYAEKEILHEPEEAGPSVNGDSRHRVDPDPQSAEPLLGENGFRTWPGPASDEVTLPPEGSHMLLLLPNLPPPGPSWGRRAKRQLAKGKTIIKRYARLIRRD